MLILFPKNIYFFYRMNGNYYLSLIYVYIFLVCLNLVRVCTERGQSSSGASELGDHQPRHGVGFAPTVQRSACQAQVGLPVAPAEQEAKCSLCAIGPSVHKVGFI